jgi:hypothetical protein
MQHCLESTKSPAANVLSQIQRNTEITHLALMTRSFLCRAAAMALALLSSLTDTQAQTWTELKVADLNATGFFTGGVAFRPDGRLVLGLQGKVLVQPTYGAAAMTAMNLGTPGLALDPSFVAVRNDTEAIVGAGTFASTGLHKFNPSTPTKAILPTALRTLQNYQGVYWKHPVTGREGWLIFGGNGVGGRNRVEFVSLTGAVAGPVTTDFSEYGGPLAVDAVGNLYVARAEDTFTPGPDAAEDRKTYRFSAAQVDAAVVAVLAAAPAPVGLVSATYLFQPTGASYLAADGVGRVYASGYQASTVEVYDPASATVATLTPRVAALPGASGPTNYALGSYKRNGAGYVAWLAFDGQGANGADVIYGSALESSFDVTAPTVSFASSALTVNELAGSLNVAVQLSHRSTTALTVPVTLSGTSDAADRAVPASVVIPAGATSANLVVRVTADLVDEPLDTETCVITLGAPTPAGRGTLGVSNVFTLSITDVAKPLPVAPASFTYLSGMVGSAYSGVFFTDFSADSTRVPTSFTATALPPGLTMNRLTGEITGRATVAGRYASILVTVSNARGSFKMGPYVIDIADYDAEAQGSWVGLVDRDGTVTGDASAGLGARLDVTTARNGSVSGKLLVGAKLYSFTGLLDTAAGGFASTINIPRTAPALPYTLTLNFDPSAQTLAGSLSDQATTAGVSGWRSFWSATNAPLSRQGMHNTALEDLSIIPGAAVALPEGSSYASFNVAATGVVTVAGRSADGFVLATTAPMGRGGECLLYQSLYSGLGSFMAQPVIAADAGQTVTGAGSWSKKVQVGSKLYASGWATPQTLTVRGGLYLPPTGTALVMNTAPTVAPTPNVLLGFAGGGQELSTTSGNCTGRIFAPAGATTFATLPNVVSLSVVPGTGLVTGNFKATLGAVVSTVPYFAMIIPDPATLAPTDGSAAGYFLLTQSGGLSIRSGQVLLSASATVP